MQSCSARDLRPVNWVICVPWLSVKKVIHDLFPRSRPQETLRVSWVDCRRIQRRSTLSTGCSGDLRSCRSSSIVLGMAAKKQEFTEHDMQSLKHFRSLRKLLVSLHGVGASRDKAGNRELFMDQYCVLVLIWLFNPFPRFIGPTSFPIRIAPRAFSAMRSWSSVLAESTSQSPTIRSGW